MKVVNQYYNKHNNGNYKNCRKIGLYKLIEKQERMPQKKFDDSKKPNIERDEIEKIISTNEDYECIKKTQTVIEKIINSYDVTIPIICENIKQLIDKKEAINMHEIYCVVVSYSLWEVITYLLEHYQINVIQRNGHNFNTLHKSLLALWLWNFHNTPKKLPKTITRKPEDVLNTIKILISKNLVESILEPTPRDVFNKITCKKHRNETSLYLLNNTIPKDLISPVKTQIYECMTTNLSFERITTELQYIINSSEYVYGNVGGHHMSMIAKYGNCIKWIITQKNYPIQKIVCALCELFVKKYCNYEKDDIPINFTTLLEMLSSPIIQTTDNIKKLSDVVDDFEQYFSGVFYDVRQVFDSLNIELESNKCKLDQPIYGEMYKALVKYHNKW